MKRFLTVSLVLMSLLVLSGCANTCERCGQDYSGDGIDYDFYGQTLKICVLCAEKLELYKDQTNAPVESSPASQNTPSQSPVADGSVGANN